MQIKLYKKPKNPVIIEGFPGFGLVGTIASEFLIEHLKTELIGKITFEEMPAMVAIHEGKIVEPLGIFYSKEYNIVILHAIISSAGFEWKLADQLLEVAKFLSAKEIISLEGVGGGHENSSAVFYHTKDEKKAKRFEEIGVKRLKEGIIMGVTGALLLKADGIIPVSCVFAETHADIPASKAAAKIIEVLDKLFGMDVKTEPLIKQAEKFEEQLTGILQKTQEAADSAEKKKMSYVG